MPIKPPNHEVHHRILVCGGRNYDDYDMVKSVLDHFYNASAHFLTIIHGDAPGADQLAVRWIMSTGYVEELRFPAQWSKYGKHAGPIRNREMLVQGRPHLVVAFPGGRGTEDMCRQARKAGVPVRSYLYVG